MRHRFALFVAVVSLLATGCSTVTEIRPLGAEDAFAVAEQSVVFLLAPDQSTSASGVVIDGGWILTNAHVVDRHASMSVGRSDGTALGLFPVHAVDWVFDLALIGPIDDDSLPAIEFGDSSALGPGAPVSLAGFPAEGSLRPTPTLTEGVIARRRNVEVGAFPFLQVDATIAAGQSGGALLDDKGRLIGISTLEFGEGKFGLAFASEGLEDRIDKLVAADQTNIPTGQATNMIEAQVGPLRNYSFLVEVDESGKLDIVISSALDIWVDVRTLGGSSVSLAQEPADPFRELGVSGRLVFDEAAAGGEEVIATIEPGSYEVLVGVALDGPSVELDEITITSANQLRTFTDVEDGQMLPRNEIVEGNFDWVRDTDIWQLDLTAGDAVTIVADGLADTVVVVRFDDEVVAMNDDDGIGIFGDGSRLMFTADQTGTYQVEIGTFEQIRWGYLAQALVDG